jgi:hypothetical protein
MTAISWNLLLLGTVLFVTGGYVLARHGIERGLLGIALLLQAALLTWTAGPITAAAELGATATIVISATLVGLGMRIDRGIRS